MAGATEIRVFLYAGALVGSLLPVAWALWGMRQADAPKALGLIAASYLTSAALAVALGASHALQVWWRERYFDYVDVIRWALVGILYLHVTAFFVWRRLVRDHASS